MRLLKTALLLTAIATLGGCRYGVYGSGHGFGYHASNTVYSLAYSSGYRPYGNYGPYYGGKAYGGHGGYQGRGGGYGGYGYKSCR